MGGSDRLESKLCVLYAFQSYLAGHGRCVLKVETESLFIVDFHQSEVDFGLHDRHARAHELPPRLEGFRPSVLDMNVEIGAHAAHSPSAFELNL